MLKREASGLDRAEEDVLDIGFHFVFQGGKALSLTSALLAVHSSGCGSDDVGNCARKHCEVCLRSSAHVLKRSMTSERVTCTSPASPFEFLK